MRLKWRIFFRVSGLLAAMIAAVTGLACAFAVRHHRISVKNLLGAQLTILADRAEELVLWDDRVALGNLLRGTVGDYQVVEYAFVERQGRPYVHTFEKGVPKALMGFPTGFGGKPVVRELESEQGRRICDLAASVGDEQAVLHIGLSLEAIDRQALGEVLSIGVLGVAAIGVGVILAGVATRLITREVDQVTGTLRTEISDRTRAEAELARYRDQLEELVGQRTRALQESQEKMRQAERLASIGTFAAGVAHEINNPLASILMSAQHAQRSMQSRDMVERSLGEIVEDTQRCANIVRGILLFARQQPSEKELVSLNDAVQRAANLMGKYARQRSVDLEIEVQEGLALVSANPMELEQVFVNVIKNAIEASSEGQVVGVQTLREGGRLLVRVQDRGRGMTPWQREHAFDPFFTTRTGEGGSGLGLSIVHGTVTQHGGVISIETELGKGTTITIELPPGENTTSTGAP